MFYFSFFACTKNEGKPLHFFRVLKNENEIFHFAFQFLFVRKKQELNFYSHINPLYSSFAEPYFSCVCCLILVQNGGIS